MKKKLRDFGSTMFGLGIDFAGLAYCLYTHQLIIAFVFTLLIYFTASRAFKLHDELLNT